MRSSGSQELPVVSRSKPSLPNTTAARTASLVILAAPTAKQNFLAARQHFEQLECSRLRVCLEIPD